MYCDICHKEKAVIQLTKIINKEIEKLDICLSCAQSQGWELPFGPQWQSGPNTFPPGFFSAEFSGPNSGEKSGKSVKACPRCALTYDGFISTGKAGCAHCYTIFEEELKPVLKKMHGAVRHSGFKPDSCREKDNSAELERLEKELAESVKLEAFERAAVLRDRINALKKDSK